MALNPDKRGIGSRFAIFSIPQIMSYIANALVQCENWQERMESVWMDMPMMITDPIPFLQFIQSPENKNGVNMTVNPGNGKTRTVVLTYSPPLLESEVSEEEGRNCDVDAVPSNRYQNYEIDTDDVVSHGVYITAEQLKNVCRENPDFILQEFIKILIAIDKKVATNTSNEAALLLGDFSTYVTSDTTTYTMSGDKLQVVTKSSGAITPGAWENIQSAANASGMNGIIGFGGSAMKEYMQLTQNGCCANVGLDIGSIYNQFGFAFAYDPRLATALGNIGTQNMIMLPGALQLLTYTQNDWMNGVADFFRPGSFNSFTWTTPAGVPVDVIVTDVCPGGIKIKVIANTRLVSLPSDMFQFGDPFEGVTGTAGVVVSNS